MEWSNEVETYLTQLKSVKVNDAIIERLVHLLDLTSLNDTDTEASIAMLCEKAQTSFGHVASVCVSPKFVRLVADNFRGTQIKAGTVANFPLGETRIDDVLVEVNQGLAGGAQEIDIVFPYQRFLAGEQDYAFHFVESCKAALGDEVTLKIILETAALKTPEMIRAAAEVAIKGGADFIKTATGKNGLEASLDAAAIMLMVIKKVAPKRKVGFKVSGGVKTAEIAIQYVSLADTIMGDGWAKPSTFRIGSSQLLDALLRGVR